jgi:hypothetical protein
MNRFADDAYLMGLDDSEEECPLDFDDKAALAAVSAVRAEIVRRTGYGANAVTTQDASFFASITLWDARIVDGYEMVSIRFSAFGQMVTIYNLRLLPADQAERLLAALVEGGFVYVSPELAARPYRGKSERFTNGTWAARYFDYL